MANIYLRTPFFVTITTASHLSAQMALTIDGTLRYTILKNATSNRTVFEISSLAKDYYNPDFGGNTGSNYDTVAISYVITTFTGLDGTGTNQGPQAAVTHTGFYGYSYFSQGTAGNDIDSDDEELTNTGETRVLYLPDNTASFAWDMKSGSPNKTTISSSATSVTAASGNYTWTINRICSSKYTPVQMRFINRKGAPQDFYFFLKNVENMTTKSETFKRNIFNQSSSNYDVEDHQTTVFNKSGRKRYTLNTDYLIEAYNEVIEDILLSEYVWIKYNTTDGNKVRPVIVNTSSLLKKTSVNDKLIQYTLEVEEANDIINNIV
tara:strand:- start:96 stop:1058 length:963 start_codon:yes stop_codon:yes gene_type:complete